MSKANKIVTKLWTFKSILTAVSFHALIAVQLLEWSSSARHSLVSFPVPHLEVQCLTTKLYLLIHKLLQFPGVNQSQSVSNPHQCLIEWKKCLLSPPPLAFCSVWLLFPSDMIFSQLFKSSKPQHLSCLNGNNTCLMIAGKLLKCNREKCLVFYSFNTVFHTANQVYSLHDPARGMRVRAEKLYLEELTGRSQGCPLRV